MNRSDSIVKLAAALVKAQPEFEPATKDATNPFFKSKYADLGAVWDAVGATLSKHGLAVSQFPDNIAGVPALTTVLVHESGEWMEATYPLIVADKERTPQGYGSAQTYSRRYGLAAVLGVVSEEDEDGNHGSGRSPARPSQSLPTPPQPSTAPAQPPVTAKMSPRDWTLQELAIIRATATPAGLKDWEKINSAAMVRLRVKDESLWQDIIDNIDARAKELLK